MYGGASLNALQLRGGALYAYNRYGTDRSVDFPGFSDTGAPDMAATRCRRSARPAGGSACRVSQGRRRRAVRRRAGDAHRHVELQRGGRRFGAERASAGYDYGATTLGFATEAALFDNSPLIARTMLGWQHVFGDVTPGSTLAFESAPSIPFTITGAPVARDALAVEAGFDWRLSNNATLGVFYPASSPRATRTTPSRANSKSRSDPRRAADATARRRKSRRDRLEGRSMRGPPLLPAPFRAAALGAARDLLACLRFFSRLPLPDLPFEASRRGMPDLSRLARMVPVAGAALAAIGALALACADAVGLPPLVCAGLAVGAQLLATGALHEDGLADVADGFGGGATRERKLESCATAVSAPMARRR